MAVSSALALTLTYTQYTLKRRNLLQQLLQLISCCCIGLPFRRFREPLEILLTCVMEHTIVHDMY
jgi:hypothetical protein